MARKKTTKKGITKRQAQTIIITALILVSMFFSVYFRSYPATLPIADTWAHTSTTNSIKSQVQASIDQQYPNLPADRKATLVDQQLQAVLKQQKDTLKQQEEQQAAYIRSRLQNDDNQTYLLAIDPYYYARRVDNIVRTGTVCDTYVEDQCWDNHMVAPIGKPTEPDFHSGFSAVVYKVVHAFNGNAKVFNTFFWIPVLVSALAVIPAFFIARKRAGNLGGFIAGMIVAVHSTFLGRTAAGFSDTDAYNVFFPLLVFWLFIEAFEAKDLKRKLIYAGLTGLTLGIYSKIWQGWWYIFDFMLVTIIVYLAYTLVRGWLKTKDLGKSLRSEESKQAGISILSVLVGSGIFVSLFSSLSTFIRGPLGAITFTSIQNAAKADLWPNVYTTVAELNRASLSTIVNQIGGSAYFYLACLGLIITLISVKEFRGKDWALIGGGAFIYLMLITRPLLNGNPYVYLALLLLPVAYGLISLLKDKRDIDIKYAIFLVVWFAGTIYASTQGVRFILMIVPVFAVALGILIGQLYRMVADWASKEWDVDQTWIKVSLIILALLILIQPIKAGNQAAQHEVPSMNDAWWSSLTKIKEQSSPDAIINSWWDFGHWFKYVADRPVTFDGASQNTPMAHWIGKALATDNEDMAVGILRMLDCGSREGFDTLAMSIQGTDDASNISPQTTLKAQGIMDDLLLIKDRSAAEDYLTSHGISAADAQHITSLTHCEAPQDYLITSSDMVGKASVWGHFGLWDFKKAYVYSTLRKDTPDQATPIIEDLFNISKKDAGQLFYEVISLQNQQQGNAWISPWPQYVTQRPASCTGTNGTLSCNVRTSLGQQNGQTIVLEKVNVDLSAPQNATITIGAYNPTTGQRAGGNDLSPNDVFVPRNGTLEKIALGKAGIGFDVVIGEVNGQYRAVVATPELADSMFTRLFYLDGAYTDHFSLFSDETSTITGDRITIWNVDWN